MDKLLEALVFIRDSTFRDAASLRAYADKVINEHKAGDFVPVPRDAIEREIAALESPVGCYTGAVAKSLRTMLAAPERQSKESKA